MSFKDILLEEENKKKKKGKDSVIVNPPYNDDDGEEEDEDSIEESHHDDFHLHKKLKPHKIPTEKPKLDVGQRKSTQITATPKTTYAKIATAVINRGGSVTRSPGQPLYRGTGKKAYKATKHSQLKLGKKRLTIQPHKGSKISGKRASQLSRILSSYEPPVNDVVLEKHLSATITAHDAHDMLINRGFSVKSDSKHRKYYHPKTKESLSISRTGELSTGISSMVRKAIKKVDNLVSEEKEKDAIKLLSPVSTKTQKVIDAGKKVTKELNNNKDEKKDSKETRFQHTKTLTGASDKGNSTKTDVIEINPELKAPGKKDDKKDKK